MRKLLIIAVLVAGCAGVPPQDLASDGSSRSPGDALSLTRAAERAGRVSNVRYELAIDLTRSDKYFAGTSTLHFTLEDNGHPLTVDFSGGEIDRLVVNSKPLAPDYNGAFLTLPAAALVSGANRLQIDYRHPYDGDGTGLHRFEDPEDGRTYLYTYLWPYYANRLLPAFDQPNLKAVFELSVRAPADWEVVSVASGRIMEREGGTATWVFAPTPRISTYVFSLHAGPYQIWESRAGDVPIRLLARQSLAPHVEVDEWFEVTRAGLDFFADYFAMPYPFGKYDQLIVPDFNIGAMENVAAVTFNERTVQRTESNRFERESRAEIILHEMAHMWFGNLVTKDWWNGLWLNESFATLMAYFALVSATEFEDAWHGFFTNEKPRAYFKDSRVTTHPIEVPVDSTDEFFSVFDAITYQKGSSVLKQLAYFVGEDNFREGVRRYLAKHAYGNTVLDDFIDAQAEASGRDLAEWTREWLFTAGFNELQAEFTCREGAVSGLHIEQRAAPANPTLRTHRFQVAVYDLQDDALALRRVIDAELSGARSALRHLDGWPCPALVFPNHNDWTYARVILSDEGVAAIDGRLHTIAEPLARSMFIQSLFDMARDGRLRLGEYVRIAAAQSVREPNLRVLDQLTRSLSESVALLTRLRPEAEATRSTTLRGLEFLAWDQLEQESDRDRARLWFDLFVAVAESPQARARLRTMLDGRAELPGLVVGPEQRWEVVIALAGLGVPDVQQLIDAEALRDPSDQGAKYAIAADAARPDPAVKRAWLDRLLDPDSELGLARQRYAIAHLFPAHQTRLQEDLLVPILDSLGDLADADPYFLSSYVQGLLRPVCTKESVAAMAATLERGSFHPTVELFLREAHQADEECLALRPGFN